MPGPTKTLSKIGWTADAYIDFTSEPTKDLLASSSHTLSSGMTLRTGNTAAATTLELDNTLRLIGTNNTNIAN